MEGKGVQTVAKSPVDAIIYPLRFSSQAFPPLFLWNFVHLLASRFLEAFLAWTAQPAFYDTKKNVAVAARNR
jgi:hypothetical protein